MSDEAVVFCANCGAHLDPGAHFCGVCGHAISAQAPDAPAGQVPVGVVPGPPRVAPMSPPPMSPPPMSPPAMPPLAMAPYVVPAAPEPKRPATFVLLLGVLASLALLAAIVALVYVVRSDEDVPAESPVVTSAPVLPATSPSVTSTTTTTTVATTTTTVPPPITTVPPPITAVPPPITTAVAPPPDTFVWPDMSADAIGAVQGTIAACGQGGWVGDYSATELADGLYRVGANAMFEGDEQRFPVAWEVDFRTNRTEVRALDEGAAALICN